MIIDSTHPAWPFLECYDHDGELVLVTALDIEARFGSSNGAFVPIGSYRFRTDTDDGEEIIQKMIPHNLREFNYKPRKPLFPDFISVGPGDGK